MSPDLSVATERDPHASRRSGSEGVPERRATERAVLDALPEYLVVLDCEGRLLAANATWRRLAEEFGVSGGDSVAGRPYLGTCARVLHGEKPGSNEPDVAVASMLSSPVPRVVIEYSCAYDTSVRWFQLLATRSQNQDNCRIVLLYLDVTERKRAEEDALARARQQAVVAELGQRALSGVALNQLREDAVQAVARTFGVPLSNLLMVLSPSRSLLVAGVGWREGLVGAAEVSLGPESQAGHTLVSDQPIVVEDLRKDRRFSGSALLREHGVVSGISVVVGGKGGPWGVLGAYAPEPRHFSRDDVNFVRSIANVLAEATDRARTEGSIRVSSALLRIAAQTAHIGGWTYEPRGDVMGWSDEVSAIHDVAPGGARTLAEALRFCAADTRTVVTEAFRKCLKSGEPFDIEAEIVTARGRSAWVRAIGTAERSPTGEIIQLQGAYQDITDQKHAQRDLARANRALQMLSRCNEVVARSDDETGLLNEICKIAVEIGGYRMAFVGCPRHDAERTIAPVAHAGYEAGRFLAQAHMSWSNERREGRGAVGSALRSGSLVFYGNLDAQTPEVPWSALARECGYRAVLCVPLKDQSQTLGVFCLYAGESRTMTSAEARSLQELAANVTFGVRHVRNEAERRRMQTVLEAAAEGVATAGNPFFEQMARGVCRALGAFGVFVLRVAPDRPRAIRGVTGVADDQAAPPADDLLEGGLAELLLATRQQVVPERLAERFPGARRLLEMGAVACAAERLDNVAGTPIGFLCVAFRTPLESPRFVQSALGIFAARMAGELARQEADTRIREQAALLDKAHDAIILQNLDMRVVYWNAGAARLYGWRESEILGASLNDKIYADGAPPEGAKAEVLAHGEWTGEIAQVQRDGKNITVESHWTLVKDGDGWPHAILHINTDITKRLAVENQLKQAQRLEAIGQLTGGIAHDFNNLLTVIMGSSDLLVHELSDRPDLRRLVDMSRSAAERGAQLTKRLLAFARRQALAPRPVDIERLLVEMDGLLRSTVSEDIEIRLVCSSDLWSALVDPAQLESALLNLCINARDAMPAGGKMTIETCNFCLDAAYAEDNVDVVPGEYILIAVSDTGCGISSENLQRVFDPFFTTKEFGKGTGLGLSMVYGFVRQSHGYVKIYSEVGHGTTVKMFLPRALAQDAGCAGEGAAPEACGGTERVLLVEDNDLVRHYATRQLQVLGYDVVAAQNANEALGILEKERGIALLFTDVVMPGGMNGFELGEKARALDPGLKVLYTSGYTENALVDQGCEGARQHFLHKPYRPSDLARLVREALGCTVEERLP